MKVLSVINNDKDAVTKEYVDSKAGVTAVDPTSGPVETDFFIPTKTSELTNDSGFITEVALTTKQDTLVSGTNIKTINNESILGSGNINLQDQLLDIFYPIGSYYETSDTSFDPNVTWGGTWVKDSKGRVTVALDDSDADFNTISKTGGEKTHKLTIDEMPSHAHYVSKRQGRASTGPYELIGQDGGGTIEQYRTSFAGNDLPHNNLQPYIVVVRWHRTA